MSPQFLLVQVVASVQVQKVATRWKTGVMSSVVGISRALFLLGTLNRRPFGGLVQRVSELFV